ncbi:hypothetical protein [Paenibacillus piscarius]|uniref:hypothetical protein n=1 Tax=Paenibacillus piscarius TaxID=1089681 RepID=UPI001EE96EBB|nr:hypothetical protein [Paenibacillus piscarius]
MKVVKRALGICLIVLLSSVLSMLTTAYVVNTYIQSVLASFEIKVDGPGPGISGFVKSLTGMGGSPASKDTEKTSKESGDQAGSSKVKADEENKNGGATSGHTNEKTVDDKVPEDALPVMGQAAGEEQSGGALDQNLVMTPEAMNELKENLPADEKTNIFNILMTKLPQEEMIKISAMLEGGLTESEAAELQGIIAKYVDADEYNALMKMLTPSSKGTE